jgi:hypothetical protein
VSERDHDTNSHGNYRQGRERTMACYVHGSRGTRSAEAGSSPEDVAIEIRTKSASWPWNLSTVPTGGPSGKRDPENLYGCYKG